MASAAAPAPAPMAAVSHVIFDMDGLLLDTEGFYTEVQEKILARYGKVFDWSLKAKMMGKKAMESARIFVDECGLTGLLTPEQFLEERESMLQELFPSCAVMPGQGLPLPSHLQRMPLCIFAFRMMESIIKHNYEVKHDDSSVNNLHIIPIFLAHQAQFGVDDSIHASIHLNLLAAPLRVVSVVMVPDPRLDVSYHKGADQVLSSLQDFNPGDWGLPPFED
ncbi:hypothetical protein ABZP36_026363 [Zizania latifolia]